MLKAIQERREYEGEKGVQFRTLNNNNNNNNNNKTIKVIANIVKK